MDETECAHCGKMIDMEAGPRLVLRPLSTGEQEEILVCQECSLLFDDHIKYLFTILGGLTSTDENQPPVWQNPVSLFYQGHHPTQGELTYVRLHDPERYANVVGKPSQNK
jgi:hypothetical protein